MTVFKFLAGGSPYIYSELPETLATWTYYDYAQQPIGPLRRLEGEFNGIADFLSRFHSTYIVHILYIIGPDGYEFNFYTQGRGWGFNIQTENIKICWIEDLPE